MKKAILLSIIMTIYQNYGCGQEKWSLEKCITEAVNNNLSIEESEINVRFNEMDLQDAKNSRHPNLSGSSSLGWNFGRTIDPTTNSFISQTFFSNNFGLNSQLNLYNGGLIVNQIKQAKLNMAASEEDLNQFKRDISLQTALFFLNVIFSEENLQLAKNQLKISQDQLDQLDKFIKAGMRPENDRLDLEVQFIEGEQAVILAENSYDLNMLQLKQLMRIDMDMDIVLSRPANMESNSNPDLLEFDEVFREAIRHQPGIAASELRVNAAEHGINIARSAFMPSLAAFGNLQTNYSNQGKDIVGSEIVRQELNGDFNGTPVVLGIENELPIFEDAPYFNQFSDNLSYGFGFGLNVPIYNRNQSRNNVERAKLTSISSSLSLERTKENLKLEVQQALIDARAAKKKLEASKKSEQARIMAFDNSKRRFEIGAISSFELTNSQELLESAQITTLIDKYDYLFKLKVLDFYIGKPIKL